MGISSEINIFQYTGKYCGKKGTFYVPISQQGIIVGHKLTLGMKAWIVQPMAAYTVYETPKMSIDLAAGARYLWVDVETKLERSGPLRNKTHKISDSNDVTDAIAGIRATLHLTDKWNANVYLDGGGGNSDSTWQTIAGFNYKFDSFKGIFGYRYIKWDFDDKFLLEDLIVKGPYLGAKFEF